MGEEKPLDPSSTSSIPPVVAPFGAPKPAAPAPAVDAKAQLSMTINLKPIMHGPATAPKTGAIGVKPPTPVPSAPAAASAPALDPKAVLSTTINLKPIMHTPAPAPAPAAAPVSAAPAAPAATAAKPSVRSPTVGGLRPGLKLPPRPGTPTIRKPMPTVGGLRPGLKLPSRPSALAPKPAAPAAPAPAPASAPAPAPAPQPAPAAAPAAPVATQKTASPIPAQAVLRKTGIIAEGLLTPQQSVASKTKTSRIPLESAIGGASPVEPSAPGAPLKTIRLRRPTTLAGGSGPAVPAPAAPNPGSSDAAEAPTLKLQRPGAPESSPAASEPDATVTQKKTLKLQRPGAPAASGAPMIKKPATIKMSKPGLGLAKPGAPKPGAAPADGEIKEMSPEEMNEGVSELKPLSAAEIAAGPAGKTSGGVSKGVGIMAIITSVAALGVLGFTVFYFASQCFGPAAGANDLASFYAEQPFGPAASH